MASPRRNTTDSSELTQSNMEVIIDVIDANGNMSGLEGGGSTGTINPTVAGGLCINIRGNPAVEA
jgi:hypothetical protein